MGGKHTRTWKYICLCIAGLIILSGCAAPKVDQVDQVDIKEQVVRDDLLLARRLFEKKDFKGSIRENLKVYSHYTDGPPGDRALYNIGLIYAHNENPEKDYKKAVSFLNRLIREYPRSALSEEAKVWISVLDIIERSKEIDIEIEKKKKELSR